MNEFKLKYFENRKTRVPRIWSNYELKKFTHLFDGDIINVSGWKDQDKQGNLYNHYFKHKSDYFISNYETNARGFQGNLKNEFFLDLEAELSKKYVNKFDVVFNHTVLEHVFEIEKAFKNLCDLSKDIVIVVVPFMQEQHADYGDYWRFTPLTIKKLFEKNNLDLVYLNYNDNSYSSIYIFAIGSKKKDKWQKIINHKDNKINKLDKFIGKKIIKNNVLYNLWLISKNSKIFFKRLIK